MSGNYTQEAAAQDAAFSIAGVNYTSPSNTVSNALNGVTLTCWRPPPARQHATLSVANDTAPSKNISAFVTAYNTLQSCDRQPLGSYDASTGTAGPMLGNPLLTGTRIRSSRRSTASSAPGPRPTTAGQHRHHHQQRRLAELNSARCRRAVDQLQRGEQSVQRHQRYRRAAQYPDHQRSGQPRAIARLCNDAAAGKRADHADQSAQCR
jgi:hypothetical protein